MTCREKSKKRWYEKIGLLILAVRSLLVILMSTVSEAVSEWTQGSLGDTPKLREQGGRWVIDVTKARKKS